MFGAPTAWHYANRNKNLFLVLGPIYSAPSCRPSAPGCVGSPKSMSFPEPWNMTLCGKKGRCGCGEDDIITGVRWALNAPRPASHRRVEAEAATRRRPRDDKGGGWSDSSISQGFPVIPARHDADSPPQILERTSHGQHLDFGLLASRTMRLSLRCFKWPTLRWFVMAATGHCLPSPHVWTRVAAEQQHKGPSPRCSLCGGLVPQTAEANTVQRRER